MAMAKPHRESSMHLLDEYDRIAKLIEAGNITFVRYNDGETLLVSGQAISTDTQAYLVDKWSFNGGTAKIRDDMIQMLNHPEWYYGIPCQCCNNPLKLKILSFMQHLPPDHITFGNLFVNAAYPKFAEWVQNFKRPVVLIANHRGDHRNYPFPVAQFVGLPDDCVNEWENSREVWIEYAQLLAQSYNDTLFLFSGGPLKVMIHFMYNANPNNTYLDVGSAIGQWVHGHVTRPYQTIASHSEYFGRNCVF